MAVAAVRFIAKVLFGSRGGIGFDYLGLVFGVFPGSVCFKFSVLPEQEGDTSEIYSRQGVGGAIRA